MAEVNFRIRKLRQMRGWSTYQLAERVGLTGTSISRIETGRQNITLDTLSKIAFALGVRLIDLFEDETRAPYAVPFGVIGAEGGANILAKPTPFPVPLEPLANGAYSAFVTPTGYLVGLERVMLDLNDLGRLFVILYDMEPKAVARFDVRHFEDSSHGPGFQAQSGDPAWRWIKLDDRRIQKKWIVEADIRYFGERPDLSRFTPKRSPEVDKSAT